MSCEILIRSNNYQIKSVYDRRFLVQRYNLCNGRWMTVHICDTRSEAEAYLTRKGAL